MTQTSTNYGRALYELSVSKEIVAEAEETLKKSEELAEALESPLVSLTQKEAVIRRVFPKELTGFFGIVCKYGHASLLKEIFQAYREFYNQSREILDAVLYYVEAPEKEQIQGMKQFLKEKYGAKDVALEMKEEKSLIGGFILRVKDQEFDYSLKGRINALQQKLIWR